MLPPPPRSTLFPYTTLFRSINFRPEMVEVKKYGTSQLPVETIPLLTFENGKAFERDGERGSLKDYAINEVGPAEVTRSEEHTSELQSQSNLVCRLLLEKKKT